MASAQAKGKKEFVEGKSAKVAKKNVTVSDICIEMREALQSACSYQGANTLEEFFNVTKWELNSPGCRREDHARI